MSATAPKIIYSKNKLTTISYNQIKYTTKVWK